jgi:hypothetical protein
MPTMPRDEEERPTLSYSAYCAVEQICLACHSATTAEFCPNCDPISGGHARVTCSAVLIANLLDFHLTQIADLLEERL